MYVRPIVTAQRVECGEAALTRQFAREIVHSLSPAGTARFSILLIVCWRRTRLQYANNKTSNVPHAKKTRVS